MRITLGSQTYDLTTRALVIGPVASDDPDPSGAARRVVAAGADVVEVATAAHAAPVAAAVDVPVGIATARLDVLRAAYQAGAVLGTCSHPGHLAATAQAGATAIVTDPALAAGAGLPADRVVVDVTAAPPAAAASAPVHPLLITAGRSDTAAVTALGVMGGVRLVRAGDVRAARRAADVIAAILEAGR